MDKRDMEDVMMQGRETANEIMDNANKEINDTEVRRALGKFWNDLPEEIKMQMAQDKPDVVKQMNELYGGKTETQGNPWGSMPVPDKSKSPFSGMKGR